MTLNYSVALCTHNGSQFIKQQLLSILRQTILPNQIVISDDCSTDNTMEIVNLVLNEQIELNPKLANIEIDRFVHETNKGVSENFTFALDACIYPLIFLSDQDDYWVETKAEEILGKFAQNPNLLLVFTDSELIDEAGLSLNLSGFNALGVSKHELIEISRGNISAVLLKRNLVTGATMCINKTLFERATPFPQNWIHDEWLALVASLTGEVELYTKPLTYYRQHEKNVIGIRKPSLKNKLGRIFSPGLQRNEVLLSRALTFSLHPVAQYNENIRKISKGKLAHENKRSSFPRNRVMRLPLVIQELLTGRYFQFGLGFNDFLRDVFQPYV